MVNQDQLSIHKRKEIVLDLMPMTQKWPSWDVILFVFCVLVCFGSMQSLSDTNDIFHRIRTKNYTICMETEKTLNSQSNLEKVKQSCRNQAPGLQTILQSHSNQDSMVLAKKQKYRSIEQDRKPRDKPTHIWSPYLW